jgi:hypothetical protein
MRELKFSAIKEKKEERYAVFKTNAICGSTEINLSLSVLVEDENEEFPAMVNILKNQALKDYKTSISMMQ